MIFLSSVKAFIISRKGMNIEEEALDLSRLVNSIDKDTNIPFIKKYLNLLLMYYNKSYLKESQRTLVNKSDTREKNIFVLKLINYLRKDEYTPNSVMKYILSSISAFESDDISQYEDINKLIEERANKVKQPILVIYLNYNYIIYPIHIGIGCIFLIVIPNMSFYHLFCSKIFSHQLKVIAHLL